MPIETGDGIANGVVEIAAGFDLETRKYGDNFTIGIDDGGSNCVAGAVLAEKLEERGIAEVLFKVRASIQIFSIDLGDG